MSRAVLLFLHGGGYTKECWNPIIKRIQQSPLLQRVPCEIANLDWRFHGEKSDRTSPATLSYLDGDTAKPRVLDHALREWPMWGVDDVRDKVNKLRATDATRNIVAIGHSMGATTMLKLEIEEPGTFHGLIAFEPVHKVKHVTQEARDVVVNTLVSITSSRPGSWDIWEEVTDHFKNGKMYRRWHPECMDAFLEQGVRQTRDGKFVLATSPLQEAAVYCHTQQVLDFGHAACPVTIEHAEKSFFFDPSESREAAEQFPHKITVADAIPNTTHSMVVEDPEICANRILTNLSRLPLFK